MARPLALASGALAALLSFIGAAAPPVAKSSTAKVGWLCVGANERFALRYSGDCFHAVSVALAPGQKPPAREQRPCSVKRAGVHRYKVGNSPWFEAPGRGHRCVAVPLGKKVWFRIRRGESWKQGIDAGCRSHAMDLWGPNAYAAKFFLCTKRNRSKDEVVATARSGDDGTTPRRAPPTRDTAPASH